MNSTLPKSSLPPNFISELHMPLLQDISAFLTTQNIRNNNSAFFPAPPCLFQKSYFYQNLLASPHGPQRA